MKSILIYFEKGISNLADLFTPGAGGGSSGISASLVMFVDCWTVKDAKMTNLGVFAKKCFLQLDINTFHRKAIVNEASIL